MWPECKSRLPDKIMKIFVKAKPLAKEEKINKVDETHFVVLVKEPPVKGLANRAIQKVLAEHFNISVAKINLVSGFSSREKIFEIMN